QSRGLVNLDHLPRQAGAQIALGAIHHAEQRRYVMWKLGPAAVADGVDIAEVVLEVDPCDDWHDGTQDPRKDVAMVVGRWVVRNQEGASIEEQPACARAAADDAEGIGRVAVLGTGLRQV